MKKLRIAVVGDTPGTYVCAIYLFTANIPLTVVRTATDLEYACGYVPGLAGISKEEFLESSYRQAKNMGVAIIDAGSVAISRKDGVFVVETGSSTVEADILVLDRNGYGITQTEHLHVIEAEMECREAIVVAGAGCKIAFAIKAAMG